VLADDDADHRHLARAALRDAQLNNDVHEVGDGVELLDYLKRRGAYADAATSPRPGLILLDLNMPVMDGRDALQAIKQDPDLHTIPVVVLTTSKNEEDVVRSYELGVNAFITKPVTFPALVEVMRSFAQYWLEIVELPAERRS
jgi:CheY-like chemotaxis protein